MISYNLEVTFIAINNYKAEKMCKKVHALTLERFEIPRSHNEERALGKFYTHKSKWDKRKLITYLKMFNKWTGV